MNWDIAVTAAWMVISVTLIFLFRRLAGDRLEGLQSSWIARLIAIGVIALVIWLTLSRAE